MPSKEIRMKYSCKRKRDYMTFFALAMFFLTIAFEFYLIFVVPIQLKSKDALEKDVAKLEMLNQLDLLRQRFRGVKTVNDVQKGERDMCQSVLDSYAMFVRQHQDELSMTQILELKDTFTNYERIYYHWTNQANPSFYIIQEKLDMQKALDSIHQKIQSAKENRL